MQFFANKYRFNDDGDPVVWQPHVYNTTVPPHAPWTPQKPYTIRRSNFDDTLAAFTTIFQCLTEESWNFVMYDGIRAAGWSAAAYFVIVMVICNIIILNLFLAILLGNFGLDEVPNEAHDQSSSRISKPNAVVPMDVLPQLPSLMTSAPSERRLQRHRRHSSARSIVSTRERTVSVQLTETQGIRASPIPPLKPRATIFESSRSRPSLAADSDWESRNESIHSPHFIGEHSVPESHRKSEVQSQSKPSALKCGDRSLFLFSRNSRIRHVCDQVVHNAYFENALLFCILVSCIELSLDNPLNDPNSTLTSVISIIDIVVTAVFALEMMLKVVSLGLAFNGPASYIKNPWNVLDFAILISSVATLFSSNNTIRSLRSMRTLRALVRTRTASCRLESF